MLRFDGDTFERGMKGFLDEIETLFNRSGMGLMGGSKTGQLVLGLLIWDQLIDTYDKHIGESGEETFSRYYYAKALACVKVNRMAEGKKYFERARSRRTQGKLYELCKPHFA